MRSTSITKTTRIVVCAFLEHPVLCIIHFRAIFQKSNVVFKACNGIQHIPLNYYDDS